MLRRVYRFFIFPVFILCVIDLFSPKVLSVNLRYYDHQKYEIAHQINKHPSFTKGEVSFHVCFAPLSLLIGAFTMPKFYPNDVFLSPSIVSSDNFFDITIAHELGHLENYNDLFANGELEQAKADTFASHIVGKERLRSYRLAQGFPKDHYLIRNLEN